MADDSPCKPNCPTYMVEVSPNVCQPPSEVKDEASEVVPVKISTNLGEFFTVQVDKNEKILVSEE
jgi:hypothetical protein